MIPAVCSICADYFESEHTVVTCPCGHVFHEHCILQWFETSHTCPQCRGNVTRKKLVRLFFEVQEVEDGQLDPTKLKNEVGELQAEISRTKKEKVDLGAEVAHCRDRAETLSKNVKKITKKLSDEQATSEALKKQLSLMSYRMDEAKEAKREAKRLREKLQCLERFELVMSRNAEMVDDMLREFGEGANAARELATYCASLKREFENIKEARKQLKEENGQLRKDLNGRTRALDERSRDVEAMQHSVVSLQDDVQLLERDKRELSETIEFLESALSTQGGSKPSALDRANCFTPSNLKKKPRLSEPEDGDLIILDPGNPQTPDLSLPSPSVETKSACREMGIPFVKTTSLAHKKKRCENTPAEVAALKNILGSSSLFNQRRSKPHKPSVVKKSYDGMGGRDSFMPVDPVIIRSGPKKGARGLKRKPSGKPCSHPLPTLNQFGFSS